MKLIISAAFAIALTVVGLGSYVMSPVPPAAAHPTDVRYTVEEVDALRAARHVPEDVVVLPPWQIERELLEDESTTVLAAFPGDPQSRAARAYLASTGAPTGAGYLSWLSAHGLPKPRLRLVAVGSGPVMPGHDHRRGPSWLSHAPLVVVG